MRIIQIGLKIIVLSVLSMSVYAAVIPKSGCYVENAGYPLVILKPSPSMISKPAVVWFDDRPIVMKRSIDAQRNTVSAFTAEYGLKSVEFSYGFSADSKKYKIPIKGKCQLTQAMQQDIASCIDYRYTSQGPIIYKCGFNIEKTTVSVPGGIYPVTYGYYFDGMNAFEMESWYNNENLAQFFYPAGAKGSLPIVVLMHGMHESQYQGKFLPNFLGYNYLGEALASQGFFVISISANAINTNDSYQPTAMKARAKLINFQLQYLKNNLQSKLPALDFQNVAILGHSRAGEGVVYAYNTINPLKQYGIKAVFSLAPTDDFKQFTTGVTRGIMLGYCDGDVDSLDGVYYFDNAMPGQQNNTANKYFSILMGANHNYFNTVWGDPAWGGVDDWINDSSFSKSVLASDPHCGTGKSTRLTQKQQQAAAVSYIVPFFQNHLQNKINQLPPASKFQHNWYQPANSDRLLINTLLTTNKQNNLGGAVTIIGNTNTAPSCGNWQAAASQPVQCIPINTKSTTLPIDATQQPHTYVNGASFGNTEYYSVHQYQIFWQNNASWANAIPSQYKNFSAYKYVQFRVAVDFAKYTSVSTPSMTLTLTDTEGHAASKKITNLALFYPPGDAKNLSPVPRILLHMIQIPLTDLVSKDSSHPIDLGSIQSVTISMTGTGNIIIADLMLSGKKAVSNGSTKPATQ
ncbi:MAG: hypothetical protein P1U40_12755 [Coxiellaceae bacterium]|nr:hypothetical protein [Coxiellaceae bacterium]